MPGLAETEISRAIIDAYHRKMSDSLDSNVVIVGAGPSGMTAAILLARQGHKVILLEKRLSPGGGIWGGGMAMSEAVIQDEALPILDDLGVRHKPGRGGLHSIDAIELAAALCLKAVQSGAVLFNLLTVEDVCIHHGRVTGVVVNRSMIAGALAVDPIAFSTNAVIDATGHEAALVEAVRKRGLLASPAGAEPSGEGPMDAASGEAFVVENVKEVFPGLWVCGMSVCATLGGPRMGPIFGGMLLSGERVAALVSSALAESGQRDGEPRK